MRAASALRQATQAGPAWALDGELAALLHASLFELSGRRPPSGPTDTEWGTALVIALLQLRYHDRASVWSPLVLPGAVDAALLRSAMECVCELCVPPAPD